MKVEGFKWDNGKWVPENEAAPKKRGISGIYALEFRTQNLVYVGQSVNIGYRFSHHKSLFRSGYTSNPILMEAWTKEEPVLVVVETCEKDRLNERERAIALDYQERNWTLLNRIFIVKAKNMIVDAEYYDVLYEVSSLLSTHKIGAGDLLNFLRNR